MVNKKLQVPVAMSFKFPDENGEKWYFSSFIEGGKFRCELMFPANADPIKENFDQLTKWSAPGPYDMKHALGIFRALNSGGMSKKFVKLGHQALIAHLTRGKSKRGKRTKKSVAR